MSLMRLKIVILGKIMETVSDTNFSVSKRQHIARLFLANESQSLGVDYHCLQTAPNQPPHLHYPQCGVGP